MVENLHAMHGPRSPVHAYGSDDLPDNLVYYPPNQAHTDGLILTDPQENTFWQDAKRFILKKYRPGPPRYVLTQLFPILQRVSFFRNEYTWQYFIADVLAGATVCTLLIPQSLSYATLAGLPPQLGLQAAFVACFIYFLFGTCRETSLGPFALVSLLVSQLVNELNPTLVDFETANPVEGLHLRLQATMSLTLITGIYLFLMAVLKQGWWIDLFSSPSLQAFLTGAAYSVGATQIGALFGIATKQGSFIITMISLLKNISKINFVTTLVGIITVVIVACCDVYSSRKKLKIPIPSQLILVGVVTIISWLLNFHKNYNVKVIGAIPAGFIRPVLPTASLVFDFDYWLAAIPVAVSSFVVLTSISAQMAEKFRHEYSVNYNSETLAVAMASLVGAFCNTYPSSAAYSRTTVCLACKPKTSVWNLSTAFILFLVILVAGPFIFHLPLAVLAAVVLASFRATYMNWRQGVVIWQQNRAEGCVYYVTFLATIMISIQAGVFAALIASLMHIVLKQMTTPIFLEQIPHTQRFIATKYLPTDPFYAYLQEIEDLGGIYKVNADEAAQQRKQERAQGQQEGIKSEFGRDSDDLETTGASSSLRNRRNRSSSFDEDSNDDYNSKTIEGSYKPFRDEPETRAKPGNIPPAPSNLSSVSVTSAKSHFIHSTQPPRSLAKNQSIVGELPSSSHRHQSRYNHDGDEIYQAYIPSEPRDHRSASMVFPQQPLMHLHPPSPITAQPSDQPVDLYGDVNDGPGVDNETLLQHHQHQQQMDEEERRNRQQEGLEVDIRILTLHLGAPLTFLNAAPVGDYIIKYLLAHKKYCAEHPQTPLEDRHPTITPADPTKSVLPLAPSNLKTALRHDRRKALEMAAVELKVQELEKARQEQRLGLFAQATRPKTPEAPQQASTEYAVYDGISTLDGSENILKPQVGGHLKPAGGGGKKKPKKDQEKDWAHDSTIGIEPIPDPDQILAEATAALTTGGAVPGTFAATSHAGSLLMGLEQAHVLHPVNRLTYVDRRFIQRFSPSHLLSSQQQLLLSTMLQETLQYVPEPALCNFSLVIILDHITCIDITALKTLYMLQQTYPHLVILFTHPGEELIAQLTFDAAQSKTENLIFPTKLIFDSIYLARQYATCLLNSAEQGKLFATKEQTCSVPYESQDDLAEALPPPKTLRKHST